MKEQNLKGNKEQSGAQRATPVTRVEPKSRRLSTLYTSLRLVSLLYQYRVASIAFPAVVVTTFPPANVATGSRARHAF